MTPIQRLSAWLAAVTLVPPGRQQDAFVPIAPPQGVADKGWGELHREMDDAREAWRQNPLARRLVGMVTAYVVGNGITLRSEYAPLQRFIDDFWQRNQLDQRIPEWCDELCRAGEVFPVLFTNPQNRTSTVRCVPASIVERIEWREGDYEAELRYKEAAGCAGLGQQEERWWVSPLHPSAADLAAPVMLHYAVNRPVGALRGESDLAPVLPWLKRYSRWLEDRVRLNAGVRVPLGRQGPRPPAYGAGRTVPAAARARQRHHCRRAGVVDGGSAQPQRQRCSERWAGHPVDDRRRRPRHFSSRPRRRRGL
ncbi:MAG: hypothetical protein U0X20_03395 [Caldilineaceae bacterium]